MNPLCSAITFYYVQNKYIILLKIPVDLHSVPFPTANLMLSSYTSLQ